MRRAAILVLLLAPHVAVAKPKKIEVAAGNGSLFLTFDPKKVVEAELRALATAFAPESGPDAIVTVGLESCRDQAGALVACGSAPHTPAQPTFFRDGALTLEANIAVVKAAASVSVPKQLEPAKAWLRRYRAFFAGLEERKLAYYRSWKVADLSQPIEGVDGTTACAEHLAKIEATASKDEKYRLVRFDWHNCMNTHKDTVMGPYPTAPWKAFLKANRITATYRLEEDD
ncbi:MAG: hypothetical protein SFX73_24590 [Kofleriaceae bacterium]|nr:hypothetical protein [Kofleriaceae bacterium]